MQHNTATRKARIATAFVLIALVVAIPTATAEEGTPEVYDDGSVGWGSCVYVNPWSFPPHYAISVEECFPD